MACDEPYTLVTHTIIENCASFIQKETAQLKDEWIHIECQDTLAWERKLK